MRRDLGAGISVFPIGLGCMAMSGIYGPADERESVSTIQAALDSGVTLIDTGDFYGSGHNEMLVGRALEGRRDRAVLSVKFGGMRSPDGSFIGIDARPVALRNFLAYSLRRLGVEHVDIYRPARVDPTIPIEDTVGAIVEMIDAGYVRAVGLSEAGPETIRRASVVHPLADVQMEYSMISRDVEERIRPLLDELGIGLTAYGVLSRGLLSGWSRAAAPGDLRAQMPRFSGDNFRRNQRIVGALQAFAADKGVSIGQLCVAWVLSKGARIVPLIGARTRAQLADALGAVSVTLTVDDMKRIDDIIARDGVAGPRYPEAQMRMLDSER